MDQSQPSKPQLYPQVDENAQNAPPYYTEEPPPNSVDPPPSHTYPSEGIVITMEPQAHIVIAQTVINSHHPMNIDCPHCKENVSTVVTHEIGAMNHIIAGITCPICCFTLLPCCLIAYCIGGLKDSTHKCGNCNQVLGTVKRLG